jgi:hypothetical protein
MVPASAPAFSTQCVGVGQWPIRQSHAPIVPQGGTRGRPSSRHQSHPHASPAERAYTPTIRWTAERHLAVTLAL